MRVGTGVQTDATTLKPEVSLAVSPLVAPAYGRRCVGLRPTPKIPAHARKTSGTQRTCFFVFLCFSLFSLIFLCFPCFPFFPVLLHVFLCFPCFSTFCPGLLCFPTLSLVFHLKRTVGKSSVSWQYLLQLSQFKLCGFKDPAGTVFINPARYAFIKD